MLVVLAQLLLLCAVATAAVDVCNGCITVVSVAAVAVLIAAAIIAIIELCSGKDEARTMVRVTTATTTPVLQY